MSYTLQEQYSSKNFTPAAQVPGVFGEPRTVTSITIHHWGDNGQQFDVVRDFLCTNNTPTSAHYVAQDGLVACIVNTADAAWHAGNAHGNATSIGIECRPEATDGDYQTIGELVAFIRAAYGDIPLFPHNHWTSTACPGDYDLTRIDAIARGTSPQAIPQEDDMTPEQASQLKAVYDAIFTGGTSMKYGTTLQDLIDDIPRRVREEVAVTRAGAKPNSLAQEVADTNTHAMAALGALSAIAQGIGALKTQPAAAVDVPALAAQLATALNTNQAHQLLVELRNTLPAA